MNFKEKNNHSPANRGHKLLAVHLINWENKWVSTNKVSKIEFKVILNKLLGGVIELYILLKHVLKYLDVLKTVVRK